MKVWKALDADTRMSPFMLRLNSPLAIKFPVGERVYSEGVRFYAALSQEECSKWAEYVIKKWSLPGSKIIVVPAEAENAIPNPPLLNLVRFTNLNHEMLKLAWQISDEIREILNGRTEVADEDAKNIAQKVSRQDFIVRPHWIHNPRNKQHVACSSLTCLE